jgi:hypothetical protein
LRKPFIGAQRLRCIFRERTGTPALSTKHEVSPWKSRAYFFPSPRVEVIATNRMFNLDVPLSLL